MAKTVHQLKVTLEGTKPPVWRRVVVPSDITFARLHDVLQAAFGWWNSHLHEFEIDGVRYGSDDGEGWGDRPLDERRHRLGDVAGEGATFGYVYDFGDNWQHRMVVERVVPAERGARYPACTAGRRACPPEDCGGVWGYADFVDAIRDPEHSEHESMLEWVGGTFDPEAFDTAEFADRFRPGRLVSM